MWGGVRKASTTYLIHIIMFCCKMEINYPAQVNAQCGYMSMCEGVKKASTTYLIHNIILYCIMFLVFTTVVETEMSFNCYFYETGTLVHGSLYI